MILQWPEYARRHSFILSWLKFHEYCVERMTGIESFKSPVSRLPQLL